MTASCSNRAAVLAIVLVSYLMIVLDISIVITGLPKIREDLGFSTADLSWVQNSYTLAFGGLLLLAARAGDVVGRRRMLVGGLMIFMLASLAVGLAPTPGVLLAARTTQGVGAAILAPSTLALLSVNFPEGPERTRALSLYAAVAGVGASLGLVLGGLFAGWLSWRVGFLMNVPIGIALIFFAGRLLEETPRHSGSVDILGALVSVLGMTALVYGVARSASVGWADSVTLVSVVGALALLALFVFHEARAEQPILPLRLFGSRERTAAYMARLLFLGGMVAFWFFTTQFLQLVLHYTPFQAGMAFLPTTLPNFAAAMMVPGLTRRFGNGWVLAGGIAIAVVGLTWLAQAQAGATYWLELALPMVMIGVGQGATLGPLTVAGVSGVEPRDAGAASGLINAAHQLGGSLGLAVLVVVFAHARGGELSGDAALARRIGAALMGSAMMLAVALAIVLLLIVRPAKHQPLLTPLTTEPSKG